METAEVTTKTKWVINPAHSEISFKVKHLMITNVKGVFKEFDVTLFTIGDDFTITNIDFSMNPSSVDTGDEKLNELNKMTAPFNSTEQMPVLFIGHGSPMNAIENNEFSNGWKEIGKILPRSNAILCISAHWETRGTFVTAMEKPHTIHDFGGFPRKLFDVQYPAPGSPQLAKETKRIITKTEVGLDDKWGLDHAMTSIGSGSKGES